MLKSREDRTKFWIKLQSTLLVLKIGEYFFFFSRFSLLIKKAKLKTCESRSSRNLNTRNIIPYRKFKSQKNYHRVITATFIDSRLFYISYCEMTLICKDFAYGAGNLAFNLHLHCQIQVYLKDLSFHFG